MGYGQTVVTGCAGLSARHVIDRWVAQIEHYDYVTPGFTPEAEAFTQLVWANSTHFGMARDSLDGGVVVAVYFPQGNKPYDFGLNVLPRSIPRSKPLHCHRTGTVDPDTRSVLEVLDICHPDLAYEARKHLLGGKTIEVTYMPPPGVSVLITFFSHLWEPTNVSRPL
jgi:hypothetical protein